MSRLSVPVIQATLGWIRTNEGPSVTMSKETADRLCTYYLDSMHRVVSSKGFRSARDAPAEDSYSDDSALD